MMYAQTMGDYKAKLAKSRGDERSSVALNALLIRGLCAYRPFSKNRRPSF